MKDYIKGGVTGGFAFIIVYFLGGNLLISLLIGVSIFLLISFLFAKKVIETPKIYKDNSMTFNEIIDLYNKNLDVLKKYIEVFDWELKEVSIEFSHKLIKLINVLKQNSNEKNKSETYLKLYITPYIELVETYGNMKINNISYKDSDNFQTELIEFTKLISNATEEFIVNFYREDIFDSLISMKTMEAGLKSSGLYEYIDVEEEDLYEPEK